LAKRVANLIRVWNVQVTEVLGASGFKDIKKTVGEENRLVIFDDLEERVTTSSVILTARRGTSG